ncbi:hypothetical protein [Allosphingosinicella vermicomposti]|uniref:hypothetical protein n=1 Tax=Allosphingosinicella vermicomposti TaxID=614671 RepID=UPI000D0FAFC4|nr:hypothetical protein [Allosphingosinicella vermicomposti]
MATNEAPASFGGLIFKRASLPSPASSTTYGAWPNQKTSRGIAGDASLVGEHVVRGNYTPEIRFSLNQSQNFMPALNVTRNSRLPSGAVQLAWQPIANARAYFGFLVGEAKDGTVILWTSSNAKTFIGSAGDFMDASEINRLLGQKALLTPQQTQCAVPAEVVRAVGENGMFHFTAYGPEANFSYPPKPSGNAPWNVEWTAKLLTKSAYVGVLGMSMSDMMGDDDTDEAEEEKPEKKKKGMGGFLKKVL